MDVIQAVIALAKLGLLKRVTPLIEYQRYIQTVQTVITTNENTLRDDVTMVDNNGDILTVFYKNNM